ncbi:transmembrane protein 11, mitochondrial-like [Dendronephthya gigantea]|uniref:transmembrane protein 11, mitochondrial-like n=1 Tax=Dendronephthya gigantea TaxID=151771 RepID=UPI00106960C4|nr:transmembrane protein 11, mitochondrial-like [Dendronephthya gigantea]
MAANPEFSDDFTASNEQELQEPELEETSPIMENPDDECHVIHEADDLDLDENLTQELYENEFEAALSRQYPMIIIEPKVLGDQVSKWIRVGNFIHKSSVLCSLGCLVSPLILPPTNRTIISMTLGGSSLVFAALYNISWQFDPCCKYQVEYDSHNLAKLPLERLTSPLPIILVYKDDKFRKILHNVGSLAVCIYMGYKVYQFWHGTAQ